MTSSSWSTNVSSYGLISGGLCSRFLRILDESRPWHMTHSRLQRLESSISSIVGHAPMGCSLS